MSSYVTHAVRCLLSNRFVYDGILHVAASGAVCQVPAKWNRKLTTISCAHLLKWCIKHLWITVKAALHCYAVPWHETPCYAMLCYAMLCYAMLCYAMLCYAILCYAMLCYAMLCYAGLCCAVRCCAVLCCAMLRYAALPMPHWAVPCSAMLCRYTASYCQ